MISLQPDKLKATCRLYKYNCIWWNKWYRETVKC